MKMGETRSAYMIKSVFSQETGWMLKARSAAAHGHSPHHYHWPL